MNFCSLTIVVSTIRDSEQEIAIFFVWLRLIMRFKYVFNLVKILVTSFEAQLKVLLKCNNSPTVREHGFAKSCQ